MIHNQNAKGRPGIAKAALFGFCPQCDSKTIFASATQFSKACAVCKLDYDGFNVGDGPAALMIIPIGAIIIGLAIMLDIAVRPPFWIHVLIWVPFTAAITIAFLRFAKGMMLILEYRNRAGEAMRQDNGSGDS